MESTDDDDTQSRFPSTPVSSAALALARRALAEPILNHSLRVFLIAQWLSHSQLDDAAGTQRDGSATKGLDLLFVACVCHDLGTSHAQDGPERFEVRGADAAANHLRAHGVGETDCHAVWVAIALHTSPGIAERIHPLARLVRRAVLVDFSEAARRQAEADGCPCADFEARLPRLGIERCLADAVVAQAGPREALPRVDSLIWPSSEKHPAASWPGILLRAHLENPGHDGINPAF
ncbi:HD domain-containing protein [Hirsutella rhossiliensis]|uniref:HD domain-containing protein n=1 Tax=Hirsutella rhossiliensis TaxID=111463 RepID=A0A9P8SJW6_9HYPO|nr:HD domain-containing protein [Hirsutella rhossiliensis]KAH0964609.1 HD domain-containing protein [Hirsutella rhossiliensis]